MRFQLPLTEHIECLISDVNFYRSHYQNDLITGPLSEAHAVGIIQCVIQVQFNQAMRWANEPAGGRCDADQAVRQAYPEFYPDEDHARSARHFYYKVLEPFYERLQTLVDGFVGGHHTWDVLHVSFRQIKLRVPVAVEAFGASDQQLAIAGSDLIAGEYAAAVENAGGTTITSRGLVGLDYEDRLGPWMLEIDNEGDYRIMDWTRRYERGEIELDGTDPLDSQWAEANTATLAELRRSPLTRVNARTFGKHTG